MSAEDKIYYGMPPEERLKALEMEYIAVCHELGRMRAVVADISKNKKEVKQSQKGGSE